jgi:hypothetical protein
VDLTVEEPGVRELPTVRIHLAEALLFIHPVQWRENFTIRHLACSATLVAVCGNQSKVYRASTPLVLGFVFEENRRKRRDKKNKEFHFALKEKKQRRRVSCIYMYRDTQTDPRARTAYTLLSHGSEEESAASRTDHMDYNSAWKNRR